MAEIQVKVSDHGEHPAGCDHAERCDLCFLYLEVEAGKEVRTALVNVMERLRQGIDKVRNLSIEVGRAREREEMRLADRSQRRRHTPLAAELGLHKLLRELGLVWKTDPRAEGKID